MKKSANLALASDDPQPAERSASQTVKAQLKLRELILSGDLPSGVRIAELALVETLGASRTPIRAARAGEVASDCRAFHRRWL